jgi:predicted aspartyl protease
MNFMRDVGAVLDTGSTLSGITSRAAKALGVEPVREESFTHAKGATLSRVFKVDVIFPDGYLFENIEAVEISDDHVDDFLIGMNIITQGDMALTSSNGEFTFSFRRPPAGRIIDFENCPSGGSD